LANVSILSTPPGVDVVHVARRPAGATAGEREVVAEVRVTPADDRSSDRDGDKEEPQPGQRTIRWRGAVPPQKWMNFYTKVLTRFAASKDLRLEVSFEVPVDRDQAQAKADETRSGLKELGLSDEVALS
jgi:hypothetical protein